MKKETNLIKEAKLITDAISDGFEVLNESLGEGKPKMIILKGIYAQADKKNGNSRIYPYESLKPEMDRFIEEMVETGRALGNLEHPDSAVIDPAQAAIRITKLKEDNRNWIGESVVLATDADHHIKGTPSGDIVASLINYGTKLGFSTRSLGNVGEDGIVTDLHLVTIDCVANPSISEFCESNGNRFVNGILESKSFMINTHGEILEERYNKFEKKLEKMPNTFIKTNKAEHLGKAVSEFLNSFVGK